MSDADNEMPWLEVVEESKGKLAEDPKNTTLPFKLGSAYFHLEEFEASVQAFASGLELVRQSDKTEDKELEKKYEMWIRKCNTNLSEGKQIQIDVKPNPDAAPAAPAAPAPTPTPAAASAVRHEWFQTPESVTVTFFCKERQESDVCVEYTSNSLCVTIKLATGKEFQHTFGPLYTDVIVGECSHTVGKYKVEVKLKKSKEVQWKNLERSDDEPAAGYVTSTAPTTRPAYPSSRPQKKDWDKMVADVIKDEAEEKEEGDAALNKLFRDIYAKADENTRRAMNKSFQESGGTVLSTNWEEVGAKHVDGTPPKGMEFKKYGE
jgi:suppressor of G2 allele of SKP1